MCVVGKENHPSENAYVLLQRMSIITVFIEEIGCTSTLKYCRVDIHSADPGSQND